MWPNVLKTFSAWPAAEYYPDFEVFGTYGAWINPELRKAAESYGYELEWYDPGTLLACRPR